MSLKKCPFCAEEIHEDAKKCKICGEFLDEVLKEEKLKEKKPDHIIVEKKSSGLGTTLVVLAIVALLMLITGL
jgi:uncharacterized membrane protein YvbJ